MFGLEEAVSVQLRVESCLMFCVLSVYYFSESVYVSYVKSLNESVLSFLAVNMTLWPRSFKSPQKKKTSSASL